MYFRNYGHQKTWLNNCLEKPVLEDPSTSNVVNRPKHFGNLNDSAFTIFIDPCEGNLAGKRVS